MGGTLSCPARGLRQVPRGAEREGDPRGHGVLSSRGHPAPQKGRLACRGRPCYLRSFGGERAPPERRQRTTAASWSSLSCLPTFLAAAAAATAASRAAARVRFFESLFVAVLVLTRLPRMSGTLFWDNQIRRSWKVFVYYYAGSFVVFGSVLCCRTGCAGRLAA